MLVDAFGRPFRTLRLSVTDRCNFTCGFCHNEGQGHAVRAAADSEAGELHAEQLVRIGRVASRLGTTSAKLTGGEPLLRSDLPSIVGGLVLEGLEVSLTTNGSLLARQANSLARAGLSRINVSLDTLDPKAFQSLRGGRLESVIAGLDAAEAAGLRPIKINAVLVRPEVGLVQELLRFVAASPQRELQLIQYMPEMARRRLAPGSIDPVRSWLASKAEDTDTRTTHRRRRYRIDGCWVELVDPVANPEFCGACDRLRVTADGRLKGCINVNSDAPSLAGLDEAGIEAAFRQVVDSRRPYYQEPASVAGTA